MKFHDVYEKNLTQSKVEGVWSSFGTPANRFKFRDIFVPIYVYHYRIYKDISFFIISFYFELIYTDKQNQKK